MSNAFLDEFYPLAHDAFADAGLADTLLYTPADRDRATTQCRGFVDRAMGASGFTTIDDSPRVTVRVLLADLDGIAPRAGAVFDFGGREGRYVVDRVLDEDEGSALCLVSRERAR